MFKTLRTFYGFVLEKKLIFIGFILLIVGSNILFSLNPYFYKLFVDAIPSLDSNKLSRILMLFMLVRIGGVVLDLITFWVGDLILFEASIAARIKVFKKVQDLDFAFHTEKSTGSLISAFKRGDSAFFSFFHDIHHRIFAVFISFCVMLYFFFQLDVLIVVAVTLSLIAALFATKFLIANNVSKRKTFNKEEDEISGIITDNLINFETVKLFSKENWEKKRLTESFVPWLKALWGYGNSFRLIDVTMGAIINISIFLILYLTIGQAVNLKLSVGEFVLISGFLSNFYPKLWDLVWSTRDLAKNFADIEKYFGLLEYETEVKDPLVEKYTKIKQIEGVVKFEGICHSYKGGTKNAIRDFDLTIKKGESVAFVGRSGSGKTTITKLLMRFFDPTKGDVSIDGKKIKDFKKDHLRSFFGVVPQEAVLFNNTIAFNIAYGSQKPEKVTIKDIKRAAKLANIDDFIEKLPEKYNTNVGERGIKLSGGQKQRLAIARMIMSNPDIIIFDEATSHLDSESERLIQEAFWKVAKGKTTIVIAHRLSTIQKADRIIVMDKGRIIEQGTHKNLLTSKTGLYKHLWDLQLEK